MHAALFTALSAGLVATVALCFDPQARADEAESVTTRIDLIEALRRGEVEFHLNSGNEFPDEPAQVWAVENGVLHITGRASGYAATKKSYRDFRMVVEYRWGEKTWGKREKASRDNGFFIHAQGPHGALGGSWMASIETQISEGGTGDLLVLSPKPTAGAESARKLMSEFQLDRDKERIWAPGAPRQTVARGRVNWMHRDEDWRDVKGFRGSRDVERPVGEWNRFEVLAEGSHIRVLLNGVLVNEAFDVAPSEGRILSTCLGAEIFVRRWELSPKNLGSDKAVPE